MIELDCRGKGAAAGRIVIERYNTLAPGSRFSARVDTYGSQLRVALLEAGLRHRSLRSVDGTWELLIERGLSPAQGSIPGVHHAVGDGRGSIWASRRAPQVARIDAGERRVVAQADVARGAAHLALDVERGLLYVADAVAGEILALRAADLKLLDRWAAPGAPQLPKVSPEGVVCVTGGANGTLTIARPRAGGYDVDTFPVGRSPHETAISLDGGYVFVACAGNGELIKVRLADGRVTGRCKAGDGPTHMRTAGRRIYCANSWDGTVTCVTEDGEWVGHVTSGGWAHALEITPDQRWLWVANYFDDTVAVFDAKTLERVALLETDAYPHGLDISPDGRYVIATGFSSNHLRVYDAGAHKLLRRVDVGYGSSHSAFTAGNAFVGCSVVDYVACIDLPAGNVDARIALAGRP
jgi:DNA-binding beta-propeller fold protein YncE